MNYHFDSQTLPQLIHLVKNQTINLKKISFSNITKELILPVDRLASPNADSYRIHFFHVKKWECAPSEIKKPVIIQNVEVDEEGLRVLLQCEGPYSVEIFVEVFRVSAIGSTASPNS